MRYYYYSIEKHETDGLVWSWVYWPDTETTGLRPAVRCKPRALLLSATYKPPYKKHWASFIQFSTINFDWNSYLLVSSTWWKVLPCSGECHSSCWTLKWQPGKKRERSISSNLSKAIVYSSNLTLNKISNHSQRNQLKLVWTNRNKAWMPTLPDSAESSLKINKSFHVLMN